MDALGGLLVAAAILGCGSPSAPGEGEPAPAAAAPPRAVLPDRGGSLSPSYTRFAAGATGGELADVESCGGCHADVFAQQQASAHAYSSFNNPIYRVAVETTRREVGPDAIRMCGGCHDVALLADGALGPEVAPDDPRAHAGVTCRVCHGIGAVTGDGNGSYQLARIALALPVTGDPASLARHRAAVRPLATTEMCASCHRSFLDARTGNEDSFLAGQDDLTAWQASPYSRSGLARIDDAIEPRGCVDCHMPREPAPLGDPAAEGGTIRSHRFAGGHSWLAAMLGDDAQLAAQRAALAGAASIDVAAARTADGVLHLPADGAPVRPGEALTLDVVVRNLRVGHRFPGGVLDAQDTWIELEVRDGRGRPIARAGAAHARGGDDPSAHVLRALVVDGDGRPRLAREVHRFRAGVADHTVAPRDAEVVRYALAVPPDLDAAELPLRVSARLVHRARNLALQRAACREHASGRGAAFAAAARALKGPVLDVCAAQPLDEIAAASIEVGTGAAAAAGPRARPVWRRLYEHGLGLLGGRQEDLDDARPGLERALAAIDRDPALAREQAMVLHALGRLAGKQGRTAEALAWLDRAAAVLPGAPGVAMARGEALARGWRWREASAAFAAATERAPGNPRGWAELAMARAALGEPALALAAAQRGLALVPRDADCLRVQAVSLRGLGAPDAAGALDAYDQHRRPDQAAALRIRCVADDPRCRLERDPVHTHALVPVRRRGERRGSHAAAASGDRAARRPAGALRAAVEHRDLPGVEPPR